MTSKIELIKERKYLITLDYNDEQVSLVESKKFVGTEENANAFIPIMDRDVRDNYAYLFPVPEPEVNPEEEIII